MFVLTWHTTFIKQPVCIGGIMKRVNITMPDYLAERIDKDRGDVTRSLFIRRILEKAYRTADGAKK